MRALLEFNLVVTKEWPMHFKAVVDKYFLIFMICLICKYMITFVPELFVYILFTSLLV